MRRILITLSLIASAAHAETWLQVAEFDNKSGVLLLDTASIDRGSDLRTAAFKSVFKSDHSIGDGYRDVPAGARSFRWESNVGRFNCTARTVAVSQSILHGADDQVVGRLDIDPGALTFKAVSPGSFGGLMLYAVCAPSASEPPVAKLTRAVNPDNYFSKGSRRRREEGAPVVKVCVGPDGSPLREPEVTDTSGFPELDASAITVAKNNRYAAAIQDGAPVPESCIKFKVKFVKFPR